MSLPKIPPPRETLEIDGAFIELRGLTRAEAARFQKMVEAGTHWSELEVAVLAAGAEVTLDEAREWVEKADSHAVTEVTQAIKRLSRLEEGADKSSGESDSPGGG